MLNGSGDIGKRDFARIGPKLPIDYLDWSQMPNENKEVWDIVQQTYDVHEIHKSWVIGNIGLKWKNWKCKIKKQYFDENMPCTEPRVEQSQWRKLCIHWRSPLGQELSKTNKANRSKQKSMHTAGSKSFAMIHSEAGGNLSRIEMFKRTHTKKNGKPVDPASEELMNKFKEYETQHPEATTTGIVARDDGFAQCVGSERRGRVRMMGYGANLTNTFRSSSSRMNYCTQIEQQRDVIEQLREENSQFKEAITQKIDDFISTYMRSQGSR
ncbi:uncharacterized protein LOC143866844 isoform X1 [Tasmannia lanceolata]|uniref:uncharacterized protein LOC143866844 isoform X1 n=2 Tax=Tasmannia lanceolata TaxID=3420 RepID=UPI004063A956